MAAASAAGSLPPTDSVFGPRGADAGPNVKSWLPSVAFEPAGASARRASVVTSGTAEVSEIRSGARIGAAMSEAAAIPTCHLLAGTRLAAAGPASPPVDG